jgi:hypothetical protein
MSSDPDDRPTGSEDASADMQDKLEQLDDHIADAHKKTRPGQPVEDPDPDDPIDDVAGGGTDHADHADDPEESPIVGPG